MELLLLHVAVEGTKDHDCLQNVLGSTSINKIIQNMQSSISDAFPIRPLHGVHFWGVACFIPTLQGSVVLVPCETVCTELVMARAGAGACGCRWWCVRGGPRVKPGAAQLVPTLVP